MIASLRHFLGWMVSAFRSREVSVIKIKSAPHRWSVPSAHASSEWLFGCIGPRWIAIDSSMYAGANGFHGTGLEKLDHIAAELGVTVEQDVAVGTGKRQSLAQLLYDPVAGRMLRDVEV